LSAATIFGSAQLAVEDVVRMGTYGERHAEPLGRPGQEPGVGDVVRVQPVGAKSPTRRATVNGSLSSTSVKG